MFLSFVVPVYNAEKYLKDCLESLLKQKPSFDYEIILVDDGSKDNSASICDEYASKYDFIKVYHKENEGQLLTRIYGVKKCSGDYILFLDADDYHKQDSLENISKLLKDHNYPDIFMFNFIVLKRGQFIEHHCFDAFNDFSTDFYHARELAITSPLLNALWNKCIKKEVLLKSINDLKKMDSRTEEDLYMMLSVLNYAKSFCYVNKIFYVYRQVPTSITLKPVTKATIKDKINPYMVDILTDYSKKWGFYSEEIIKAIYLVKYDTLYNLINNSYIFHGFKKTKTLIQENDLFLYVHVDAKEKIEYAKEKTDLYSFLIYLKDNNFKELKKYLKKHSLKERIKAIVNKII